MADRDDFAPKGETSTSAASTFPGAAPARKSAGKADTLAGHTAKASPLRMSGHSGAHCVGARTKPGSGHQVGRKR